MNSNTETSEKIGRDGVRKGNPLNLTINQHIFPAKSIGRFAGANGCVELNWFAKTQAIRNATPKDEAFIVKRAWMHVDEHHQTKIETKFQIIADRIIRSGKVLQCENSGISEFFALWRTRLHFRHSPIPDTPSRHVLPGKEYSPAECEMLEKNGYIFSTTRTVGNTRTAITEGRQLTGPLIHLAMGRQLRELNRVEWRLVTAMAGEFIVPDTFGDFLAVPLTPTQMLVNGYEGAAPIEWVRSTNMQAIRSSREYWFARSVKATLYP